MPSGHPAREGSGEPLDISIATSPCDMASVSGLLSDIAALGSHPDLAADPAARSDLLEKARSLVGAIQTPAETVRQHTLAQPLAYTSLAMGVDVGLFHRMTEGGGGPRKTAELAAAVGVDPDPLRRMMRHLAAMGYVSQTDLDEYKPTNLTKALTIPAIGAAYCYSFFRPTFMGPILDIHSWMGANGYKAPTDPHGSAFTMYNETGMSLWELTGTDPRRLELFNHFMKGHHLGRPSLAEDSSFYPVRASLVDGFISSPGAVLLVDVGGGDGADLDLFRRAHPDAPGRLVLEELPHVLESIPAGGLSTAVERVAHDFFTEQPVKGARAYHLRSVLHDWTDDKCAEIVGRIKDAMAPGYSRLLINEIVMPAVAASWEATYLDVLMMGLFGSGERTEDDWRALLEGRCGLTVSRIWRPRSGAESVVECELLP